MSVDRRVSRKVPEFARAEDSPGTRIDPGPYIGKIKNNQDPIRSGRLQVWIPDLGGDERFEENWRTVSYASPYSGATTFEELNETTDKNKNQKNSFKQVHHSYGMWFTVPDIGNLVLCTFVAGDPRRGYWFACVPKLLGKHMLPAIGASENFDKDEIADSKLKKVKLHTKVPVAEFNENTNSDWEQFKDAKKAVHEEQLKILVEQGLDRDDTRGVITSTSQRESPSNVYGFSTPGRPITVETEKIGQEANVQIVKTRQGGHTFVLDDGDADGKNNLVRLRSAAGHQIIMNDSEKIFYIVNSTGTAWVELAEDGKIHVFSAADINLRAQGDFNLHADKDINIQALGNFNLKSKNRLHIETTNTILNSEKSTIIYADGLEVGSKSSIAIDAQGAGSLTAKGTQTITGSTVLLNSGSGPTVTKPDSVAVYKNNNTDKDGNGQWQVRESEIEGACKIVPAHEPWARAMGKVSTSASGTLSAAKAKSTDQTEVESRFRTKNSAAQTDTAETKTVSTASKGTEVDSSGKPVAAGDTAKLDPGPKAAALNAVNKPCPKNLMNAASNPNPPGGVGNLSTIETKALMTQVAFKESNLNYSATEIKRGNYLGKYQIGSAVLVDQGYIKPDAYKKYGTAAVQYPSSWTGKNNITSKEAFLSNTGVQENTMYTLLNSNYQTMVKTGAIKPTDNKETVSGMLSTAHLLGAGGATTWRKTGLGQDTNDTTGTQYFNAGRYANTVLSKV
jgi:hypothetical protein